MIPVGCESLEDADLLGRIGVRLGGVIGSESPHWDDDRYFAEQRRNATRLMQEKVSALNAMSPNSQPVPFSIFGCI